MPTISTLVVDVETNTSKLRKGLALAGGAILAIGVAATKTALDYDDAFTKIAASSNASAADVEKWKGQVLDLAGKTAQAPKELADALYFLASAGLKSSQIMPTLAASAEASAVGLGDTADIAKITANTLNAYAGSGLKAKQVTDTLVAAVREGSANTDEFSTAIGRILPIASAAGISFGSVAASLSSLSNIGLDVNEGVTAMRGLFQALISPTSAASDAMAGIGLSAQDLLDSLQQNGLIATIRLLDTAVKKNTTTGADYMGTLRAIVPNVRSLTGFLGLTTQEADKVDTVFKRVSESTGSLDKAFKTTSESAGFKFRQALADLQVVAIKLGDLILPVLATIVDFLVKNVGPAWDATVAWLKKVWEQAEPVVKTFGGPFLEALKNLWSAVAPLIDALKKLWDTFGPIIKVVALLGVGVLALQLLILGFIARVIGQIVKWAVDFIDAFASVVDWIRNHFVDPIISNVEKVWNFLKNVVIWVKEHLVGVWDHVATAFGIAFNMMYGIAKMVVNGIVVVLNQLIRGMNDVIQGENLLTPGHFGDIPKIPYIPTLARGGIVTSPTLAMIGEHGPEAVVPLSGGFGGDITLQIDGQMLARITRDQLLKLAARNATTGL